MKKLISILLVLMMLTSAVTAASASQTRTADAMNDLGLFLGTDLGYELDAQLTRAQGVTMLVRMIGKEPEALKGGFGDPFTDVYDWAKGYVGYAWKNKITNGISATEFGSNMTMTDYMFLTLTLRALGYDDSKDDFVWNEPYQLAKKVGLVDSTAPDQNFTRAEAVEVFWNALNAKLKGKTTTLADSLIAQGVFTADEFKEAADVQKNGRKTDAGVPKLPEKNEDQEKPGSESGSEKPGSSSGNSSNTDGMTYEKYEAMSGADQKAFFDSFENVQDFFNWYNAAKAEYEKNNPDIEIGADGSVDLGDVVGGGN